MVARMLPENIEKYYVTSDESEWFFRECDKATTVAYELCHKLSTNLVKGIVLKESGFNPDNDSVPNDPLFAYLYGFYVKNLLGHYDHSLNIIDVYIERLIIAQIVREWWLKCALADQYKVASAEVSLYTSQLSNAMYSLYKPTITLSPSWATTDVTIDTETEEETDVTTDATVPSTEQEILYFDYFAEFPETGVVDVVYVDRSTNTMYDWSGTAYEVYGGEDGEYEVNYYDTDTLSVVHNLGKMSPHVEGTDGDGNTFEVIWTPTDVNSGIATWNTVGSGILRFN